MRDDKLSHRATAICQQPVDVHHVAIPGTPHGNVSWSHDLGKWLIRLDPVKATGDDYTFLHECGHIQTATVAGPAHHEKNLVVFGKASPETHHKNEASACAWVAENAANYATGDYMAVARKAAAYVAYHGALSMGAKGQALRQQIADLDRRLAELESQMPPQRRKVFR